MRRQAVSTSFIFDILGNSYETLVEGGGLKVEEKPLFTLHLQPSTPKVYGVLS